MKWTKEEEQVLKLMMEKGVAIHQMTKVLASRTPQAIESKIRRLGLRRPEEKPFIDFDALAAITV